MQSGFIAKLSLSEKIKWRIFNVKECSVMNDYSMNPIQISELQGKIRCDL